MKLTWALSQAGVVSLSYLTCGAVGASIAAVSICTSFIGTTQVVESPFGEPPSPTVNFAVATTGMIIVMLTLMMILSVLEVGYPNLIPKEVTASKLGSWLFVSATIDLFFNASRKADYNSQLKFSRGENFSAFVI